VSRLVDSSSTYTITKLVRNDGTTIAKDSFNINRNNPSFILEKLRFIDEVLNTPQIKKIIFGSAPQNVQFSAKMLMISKTTVDKTVTRVTKSV